MEDIKMIAEFMKGYDFEHRCGGLPLGDFSDSWEWLMPVVEECLCRLEMNDTHYNAIHDALWAINREDTYRAVVEFIKSKIDYFEHPNLLPVEVQEIITKYESETQCYITCNNLIKELESVGWTCDYGLSAEPYDLKPL